MMRVLLVKLSSMGDMIHTLPAITDVTKAHPDIKFTWVVEESFQEIAGWHPAVELVVPISLRKRKFKQTLQAIKKIRQQHYDLVIDAQGLIKSAIIARLAKTSVRVGFAWSSAREHIASLLYNYKVVASWDQHAIHRIRQLFAQAFKYELTNVIDYGVMWDKIARPNSESNPYLVFLHGTTWATKHWPDEYWLELAKIAGNNGFAVHVTWATTEQKMRAQYLANNSANVKMLPHLSLHQAVGVLHHAVGVVAVDTGFAHLSAALSKPIVAVYGPTAVNKAGTASSKSINLAASFSCAPCAQRVCSYKGEKITNPPCFKDITPELVWQNLLKLLPRTDV